MTESQKEWIPLYGMFVIPENPKWERAIFMGIYHGVITVFAFLFMLL